MTTVVSSTRSRAVGVRMARGRPHARVLGAPARRPTGQAIADGLAAVGMPLAERRAGERRCPRLDAVLREVDRRAAALREGTRRRPAQRRPPLPAVPHDQPPRPRRRTAVLVPSSRVRARGDGGAGRARDLGIRTPRLALFASCEPNSFVLAYEAVEGKSLDRVESADMTDDVLGAVRARSPSCGSTASAHRDMRLANIFLAADGDVWMIDFGFSELAASNLLLANDVAEFISSSSLKIGPERAVAAGHRWRGARRRRNSARSTASLGTQRCDPHRPQAVERPPRRPAAPSQRSQPSNRFAMTTRWIWFVPS